MWYMVTGLEMSVNIQDTFPIIRKCLVQNQCHPSSTETAHYNYPLLDLPVCLFTVGIQNSMNTVIVKIIQISLLAKGYFRTMTKCLNYTGHPHFKHPYIQFPLHDYGCETCVTFTWIKQSPLYSSHGLKHIQQQ